MAYQSTTTVKVEGDTSGVKAEIKKLKEELKTMGSTVTAGDAAKKLDLITKSAVPASAKLQELKKIAKDITFNGFEDADLIKSVADAIAETTQQSNTMKNAIKEAQEALNNTDEFKSAFDEIKESIQNTADEIKNLEAKEKDLKKIQDEYIAQKVDKNTPEWQALQAEIKKTEQALKKAKGEQDNFVKIDFSPLKGSLDQLTGSLSGLGGKAGGLTSVLGKMGPALTNPWTAAGAAAIGLGAAWVDYNKKLDETLQKTQQFTGLSGNDLMSLRNGIKACSDAWGKDYDTVLGGVDTLMSQFGISGEQALSIISDGFTAGADDAGQMLSMMKKYSGAFRDMGISADELTALISQTKSGIFSEEGMDLIQKAGQKLREFNSKTAESLEGIGINTEEMFAKMQSGELKTVDAVKMVANQLKDTGVQSQKAGEVLRDVFGKQGAKAGMELVTALADVKTSLDDCVEGADAMHKANKELEKAQRDLEDAMSSMFGAANGGFAEMSTKIKTQVIKYVAELINRIIDLYNESIAFRAVVQSVIFVFKAMGDVCKSVMTMIIDQWKALGTLIEGVLRGDFKMMGQGVTDFYNSFKKASKTAIDGIIKDFNVMVDNITDSRIEKVHIPVEVEQKTVTTGGTGTGSGSGAVGGNNKSGSGKKEKIDYLVAIDDDTLELAQNKLSAWQDKLKKLPITAETEIAEANEQIEKWKAEVERREFILTGKINEGPLQKLQKRIADLREIQSRLNPELDEQRLQEIIEQIKTAVEEEADLKIKLGLEVPEGPLQKLQKRIKKIEEERLSLNPEIDAEKIAELNKQLDDLVEKERKMKVDLGIEQSQKQNTNGAKANIDDVISANKELATYGKLLKGMGVQTINVVYTETGAVDVERTLENMKQKGMEIFGVFNQVGSAFSQLGSMIGGAAAAVGKFVQISIQGVTQLLPLIAEMVAAKQSEAIAGGIASASKTEPAWLIPVMIATTLASIIASFASIPAFAEGGIVPGNSYTGDKIIARLNSGEGVLTAEGVKNLHALAGSAQKLEGDVEFILDGKVIRGVLNNTNKTISKFKK